MKTAREETAASEEGAASQLAFENPLLPLASYDDDEEEEDERKSDDRRKLVNDGRREGLNGHMEEDDDDEDENEDEEGRARKRSRLIEVRRDCPYLDTVNRQVLRH